jgi:hypothetical protein
MRLTALSTYTPYVASPLRMRAHAGHGAVAPLRVPAVLLHGTHADVGTSPSTRTMVGAVGRA